MRILTIFLGQLHGKKLRGERRNQECFRTKCRKLLSVCVLALERVQNPMVVHKVGVAQLFLTLPFFISLWDLFLVVYGLCFSPLYYLHFICCKDNVPQSQKTKGGWWQASCFFIIFREWLLFAKYVTHSCILQSWNLCSWESNNNNKKMLPCWQQAVSGLWALWLPTWIPPSEELPLVLGGYQGCVSTTTHYSWRVGVFASSKVC